MAVQNPNSSQKHLAVLIDADNAPAAIVEGLFEEIAKYGVASVKRIYGDWTGPARSSAAGRKFCSTTPSSPSSNSPTPKARMRLTAH